MDDVLGGEADVWRWETAMLCTLVAVVIAALWVFLPQSEEPTSRPTTRDNEASWGIKAGRWIAPQGKALYLEAVERSVEQQVCRTWCSRAPFYIHIQTTDIAQSHTTSRTCSLYPTPYRGCPW